MDPWTEQWARLQRWFERFRKTNSGRTHVESSDHLQDEVYAFFQNCYHLKDWLTEDASSSGKVEDVEDLISNSQYLNLCADLCNGSKHLRLKRPRGSADTRIARRDFQIGLTDSIGPIAGADAAPGDDPPSTIAAQYEVTAGGKTYDAFTIAGACMAEWQSYLKGKALL